MMSATTHGAHILDRMAALTWECWAGGNDNGSVVYGAKPQISFADWLENILQGFAEDGLSHSVNRGLHILRKLCDVRGLER